MLEKQKSARISVRIKEKDLKTLQEIAEENKIEVSQVIRAAIVDFIHQYKRFWKED